MVVECLLVRYQTLIRRLTDDAESAFEVQSLSEMLPITIFCDSSSLSRCYGIDEKV